MKSENYIKHRKNTLQTKCKDTETHAAAYNTFSKGIHVILVTHTGFFLHLSLK